MKVYQPKHIKNISLLGSVKTGKTSLAEAMLYEGRIIHQRGSVANQDTVCDYLPVEHEYGHSVFPTVFHVEWLNKKLNFIDCPGSEEFIGGMISSLAVTDTALMLINAQYGVEVGTQHQIRQIKRMKKPLIFVVNQLDHEAANFDKSLNEMVDAYGKKVVQVQFPISVGASFKAVVDVLLMKLYQWNENGGEPEILPIPTEYIEKAKELHLTLIEAAAKHDKQLMEKYETKQQLSEDEMRMGIRKGLIQQEILPVFCVCAAKDMGVRRLMEFLGNVVPFVSDMPCPISTEGKEVPADQSAATSVYIFKTAVEPKIGELSFFKVMSGSIKEGDELYNASRNCKEQINQIFSMAGQNRISMPEMLAGDIGATVKLNNTRTANTLNTPGNNHLFKLVHYPHWKYRRAIKAKNAADEEQLSSLLKRMHEEQPSWIIEHNKELQQTIVYGQGEFHLQTLKWRLEQNEHIAIEFEEPHIPYRETITQMAAASFRHNKQAVNTALFGEVRLIIEPLSAEEPIKEHYYINGHQTKISIKNKETIRLEWGGKLEFVNSIEGGVLDNRFLPSIQKGIMECLGNGPLNGSYVRDIRVIVYDGEMHPIDSNEISFRLAGRKAFCAAFKLAQPVLLEPIYKVVINIPDRHLKTVVSDLETRRATIAEIKQGKGIRTIVAHLPLSEMSQYSSTLSSLTDERAAFKTNFAHYKETPQAIQTEITKANK